jgi:hypothetical protein
MIIINQWDMSYTRNAYRSLHDEAELYELVDQDSTDNRCDF